MDTIASPGTAETAALEHVAERLRTRFDVPPDVINAEIAAALSEYLGHPVRDFVPILVERDIVQHFNSAKR